MRLFIALPLPPALCVRAAALLPPAAGVAPVRPELMHVTLAFLGPTPDRLLPDIVTATAAAAAGQAPFALCFDRAGRFPPSGRPRVIWLGAGEGAPRITALAGAISAALRRRAIPFDDRPFAPHLTLARVRESVATADATGIASAAAGLQVLPLCWQADQIVVVESVLSARGPRYTERASIRLG